LLAISHGKILKTIFIFSSFAKIKPASQPIFCHLLAVGFGPSVRLASRIQF
jgi:hypothetical protein